MSEHVDELLALFALGGLEGPEVKTVIEHLAICPTCQAEAQRQAALVAALAASVPPRAPAPRLRAELLSKLNAAPLARAPKASGPARPARQPLRQPLRLGLPGWLATSMAVLAVGLIGWNVYLTGQVTSLQHRVQYNQNALALIAGANTAQMPLVGQGTFATADGNAYIDKKTQDVVLVVQQLKPLNADQTYEAWIIGPQGPVSAGLFGVSDDGWGMAWLDRPYVQGGAIGVSLEPKNGSQQPTQVVLITAR
jgi:anti-sigma-K factor RskA